MLERRSSHVKICDTSTSSSVMPETAFQPESQTSVMRCASNKEPGLMDTLCTCMVQLHGLKPPPRA